MHDALQEDVDYKSPLHIGSHSRITINDRAQYKTAKWGGNNVPINHSYLFGREATYRKLIYRVTFTLCDSLRAIIIGREETAGIQCG